MTSSWSGWPGRRVDPEQSGKETDTHASGPCMTAGQDGRGRPQMPHSKVSDSRETRCRRFGQTRWPREVSPRNATRLCVQGIPAKWGRGRSPRLGEDPRAHVAAVLCRQSWWDLGTAQSGLSSQGIQEAEASGAGRPQVPTGAGRPSAGEEEALACWEGRAGRPGPAGKQR